MFVFNNAKFKLQTKWKKKKTNIFYKRMNEKKKQTNQIEILIQINVGPQIASDGKNPCKIEKQHLNEFSLKLTMFFPSKPKNKRKQLNG